LVHVRGLLSGPGGREREAEFPVDTGSFYTVIPPSLAEELEVKPVFTRSLTTADKRQVKAGISLAYLKAHGRKGPVTVAILDAPEPLLGASALEDLGLRVEPSTGSIGYSRPYSAPLV